MSNFIIAVGHTASGNIGCGVVDRLDESNCTRQIGILAAEYLKDKGHGVNLLKMDESNTYNCEDCYLRANQANEIAKITDVELYVEIHINAGGGTGSEVLVTGKSEVANQYAVKVSNILSTALNLPNRGVKTRSLIVLNRTAMPAILVECLFADSDDADVYNPEVIAKAIVNGLIGVDTSIDSEWKLGWNKNDIGWWYTTDTTNKYYYTADNGWREINGEWYRFDSSGYSLQEAWYYDENYKAWYYLDENCIMVRGSKETPIPKVIGVSDSHKITDSGSMLKPLWKWIDGDCYAFDYYGRMYCDCVTPDGFIVGDSGAWIEGIRAKS